MIDHGPQFPLSEMPVPPERRRALLVRLMAVSPSAFIGSMSDWCQMAETWMERIGYEDEWLLNLAYRNGVLGDIPVVELDRNGRAV